MNKDISKKSTEVFNAYLGENILNEFNDSVDNLKSEDHDFSALDEWMINYIDELDNRERPKIKYYRRKSYKYLASIFILLGIVSVTLRFNVDAFKFDIFNLALKDEGKYTEIRQIENEDIYNEKLLPSYVPEGLKLIKYLELSNLRIAEYESISESLVFQVSDINTTIALDTENLEIIYIKDNDIDGFYVKEDEFIRLYWNDNMYHYTLVSNLTLEELINVAKNIE